MEAEVNDTSKRHLRGDLIETFKIITGGENVDKHQFFEFSNYPYSLRGHQYEISVKRNRIITPSTFLANMLSILGTSFQEEWLLLHPSAC